MRPRFEVGFHKRKLWDQRLKLLPGSIFKPLHKLIWSGSWKHHRFYPTEQEIQISEENIWSFGQEASRIDSIPLETAISSIEASSILLVATGPSAREFDWESAKELCPLILGVNGAPTLLEAFGLKTNALVITDRSFTLTGLAHIEKAVDANSMLFLEPEAAASLAQNSPELLSKARFSVLERVNRHYAVPAKNWRDLKRGDSKEKFVTHPQNEEIGFSMCPEDGIFPGGTVAYAALQLAVAAKPQTIDIVGLDLGGKGRAYVESPEEAPPSQLETHLDAKIAPSFSLLPTILKNQTKTRITNHSTRCPLPNDFFISGSA